MVAKEKKGERKGRGARRSAEEAVEDGGGKFWTNGVEKVDDEKDDGLMKVLDGVETMVEKCVLS